MQQVCRQHQLDNNLSHWWEQPDLMTNPETSENSDQSEAQGLIDDLATFDLATFITRKAELEGESEDAQVAPERKTHDQIISELERKTHQVLTVYLLYWCKSTNSDAAACTGEGTAAKGDDIFDRACVRRSRRTSRRLTARISRAAAL